MVFILVLILSVCVPVPGDTQAEPQADGADFSTNLSVFEVVDYALQNNPEIKAAQRRIEALTARIPQAGSLDDPLLGLGIMNLPTDNFQFDQWDMTMKQLSLSQKFPFPGKLRLQAEVTAQEAKIGVEALQEVENRIVSQVKQAFYDLYFVDQAIDITRRNKTLLEEFVKIADTKYRVGKGIQQDMILAQVEVSKIMDQLLQLAQQRRTASVRLNTLLDVPPESVLGTTRDVTQVAFSHTLTALQEEALARRPQLRALQRAIDRSEAAYQLAKLQYYPDLTFRFAYGQREGMRLGRSRSDFMSATATINIPLFFRTKQDERVNETLATLQQVKQEYQSQKNEIFFALGDLYARLTRNTEQLKLFSEAIIPQARMSLDSAISGYQVNKVDFLTLLGNQVTLFNFERDYDRLLADYQKILADLERAVGQRFY